MAINKQTIISAFDDKLTLLQWLKTINKALDEAVLTGVEVRQKGNATFTFVVTFEDGTELESNRFVLAQGESINGATIRNGHLYLSLTNGDELDAGNVKPVTSFEINASQHLIVNYGDGTSQDLGTLADFSNSDFVANTLLQNNVNYSQDFTFQVSTSGIEVTNVYNKCEVVNNILYLIANVKLKNVSGSPKKIGEAWGGMPFIAFALPTNIASTIYDIEGISAHDANTNSSIITSTHVTCLSGITSTSTSKTYNSFRFDFSNRNTPNGVAVNFNSNQIVELAIDEELTLMARIAISLF